MRQVTVSFHNEDGVWWAESDDLPGFSAAADTREELVSLVRDGVAFHLGHKAFVIVERTPWAPAIDGAVTHGASIARVDVETIGYVPRQRPVSGEMTNPRVLVMS